MAENNQPKPDQVNINVGRTKNGFVMSMISTPGGALMLNVALPPESARMLAKALTHYSKLASSGINVPGDSSLVTTDPLPDYGASE